MTNKFLRFQKTEIEQSIPDRFEKQVSTNPSRIAVIQGSDIYTYDSLNRFANRVAHAILMQLEESEEPITFLIEHGVMQIVAIIGILKAGKIYVPLDPAYPHVMTNKMLHSSQAQILITNNRNITQAKRLAQNKFRVINIDELDTTFPDENPGLSISPDALANIYYTSGSTGEPKGVMQNHRNVLHFIMDITNTWLISEDDRIVHLISCSFSASMLPVFGALLNGASVIPYDLKTNGFAHLVERLINERVNIFFTVPSVFRQFAATLTEGDRFPDLRLIVFTGEALYKKDVELYKKYFSQECVVRNLLGGSEMHFVASLAIDRDSEITGNVVPAGYIGEDKEVLLLDEDGREVGPNEAGEIAVKSRYLSPGYWRTPDLTSDVFLPDPDGGPERIYLTGDLGCIRPDGCLEHLGRVDFQVKIRGQRVETGEVETAILDIENIEEAAVTMREDYQGDKYLVAYIVPKTKPAPTVDILRAALKKMLPEYMVPSFFVVLEALPYTPNGKVDRQALPKPDRKRPDMDTAFVAPRDELETHLVRICEEVLGIHPIGVKDNFFDLGMDSILYATLLIAIEKRFSKNLPNDAFTKASTVELIAHLLRGKDFTSSVFPSIESRPVGSTLPILMEHQDSRKPWWFLESLFLFRFLISKVAGMLLPFSAAVRFVAWICDQPWMRTTFLFRNRVRLIRRFLLSIENPMDEEDIIRHSLMCNYFHPWLLGTISRITSQQFDRIVNVTGLSTFLQSYRKGRGVILLAAHYGLPHFDLFVLNRLGFDDTFSVGGTSYDFMLLGLNRAKQMKLELEPQKNLLFRSLSLYLTRPVLERGGVVRIASDGYHGTNAVYTPFHGRLRPFRAGFAELAVSTGADVIPVFTSFDITGRFKVDFLAPLEVERNKMSRQEKIESFIRQYVYILERRWAEEPGNIAWGMLEDYFASPPATVEGLTVEQTE